MFYQVYHFFKSNSFTFEINARLFYSTDASIYYGNFYSSGWPRGYTSGPCYLRITVPTGKVARISVMNLNLRNAAISCSNANDNFQIRDLLKLL